MSIATIGKFNVVQLGARMHYAVPRMLHQAGMLERLFTDFTASQGWPTALKMIPRIVRPPSVERLLGRVAKGVPAENITAFNAFGLQYVQKLRHSRTPEERTKVFLWAGKNFCAKVLSYGFGSADSVYTFNTAGLEVLQAARRNGLRTVSEQTIAPKSVEMELLKFEREAYPEWENDGGSDSLAAELAEREAAEWKEAEIILCACEFVRGGIRQCGGPVEKCVVVPYGVDIPSQKPEARGQKPESAETSSGLRPPSPHGGEGTSEIGNRPLRVLTVGAVGLRKGSPYVLAAAKQLKGVAEFRMVGSIGVTRKAEAQLRTHLELTGPVPRNEVAGQFAWADVFLLPSLCEGSATVTYEALGHGLPVICTPNTGSVVRDGMEGYIVPARDISGIVSGLETLAKDPNLLGKLGINARSRAQEYTVAQYSRRLLSALQG
jgi:glycosyltransferase involved in cell wall biosynthesis